jgi:hypothetical protein
MGSDRPVEPPHSVAFRDDQVRSATEFGNTCVGSATSDTSGRAHARTVTLAVATPPTPAQEIE